MMITRFVEANTHTLTHVLPMEVQEGAILVQQVGAPGKWPPHDNIDGNFGETMDFDSTTP